MRTKLQRLNLDYRSKKYTVNLTPLSCNLNTPLTLSYFGTIHAAIARGMVTALEVGEAGTKVLQPCAAAGHRTVCRIVGT